MESAGHTQTHTRTFANLADVPKSSRYLSQKNEKPDRNKLNPVGLLASKSPPRTRRAHSRLFLVSCSSSQDGPPGKVPAQ